MYVSPTGCHSYFGDSAQQYRRPRENTKGTGMMWAFGAAIGIQADNRLWLTDSRVCR